MPKMVADGQGHVYAAWVDDRNIPQDNIFPGIYFNLSSNDGATWNPAGATRIDRAPLGGFLSFSSPALCTDTNGHVYAAWLDNAGRADRGKQFAADGTLDVYFNRSSDRGITWNEEDIRIERTMIQAQARDVSIGCNDKGVVAIVWADNSGASKFVDNNFNLFFNHSEDFGRTFLDSRSNIRLDTGVSPGTTNVSSPSVKVDKMGNIYVVWADTRTTTQDIYFNFSVEKGKDGSWQEPDIRLDYPSPPGESINPVMAIDNLGHVSIAWQDTRDSLARDTFNIYHISGFLDIEALLIGGQRLAEACFIATAAYGSPFEPQVALLREFRDRYLLTNAPGRLFVYLYYRLSPPAARFIARHNHLRAAVRVTLLPAVGMATLALYSTPGEKAAILLALIAAIAIISYFLGRRKSPPRPS